MWMDVQLLQQHLSKRLSYYTLITKPFGECIPLDDIKCAALACINTYTTPIIPLLYYYVCQFNVCLVHLSIPSSYNSVCDVGGAEQTFAVHVYMICIFIASHISIIIPKSPLLEEKFVMKIEAHSRMAQNYGKHF